jgi:poly(3-hydroxybutyrate) depolymerase
MLYHAYETRRALSAPLLGIAAAQSVALKCLPDMPPVRALRAVSNTLSALQLSHNRPSFGIDTVSIDGKDVAVYEEAVTATPFGTLLRFEKDFEASQPRVLVVPGLAGHFGTLVRATVRTLLPDHEVYVADWHNARYVPASAGPFGLDEYIEHLMDYLAAIGPGVHLMAVCQPCVPVLAAAALMEEDGHPAQPRSVILLAGPVDARVHPGPVNDFATKIPPALIERTAITTVPWPHRGHGRRVYPGFLQIAGFVGMDPRRHMAAFRDLMRDIASGDDEDADRTLTFYDEYFAVLDIAAECFLETSRAIFRDHDFACGQLRWRGRLVDPGAITTALITIEGEKDEICPPGQTFAAHDLCTGIPATRKRHHLQASVGHYGVFSGSRFEQEIYPEIRRFVADYDGALTRALPYANSKT